MFFKEIESINGELKWANFYLSLGRIFGNDILNHSQQHHVFLKLPYTDFIPHLLALGMADSIYEEKNVIEHGNIELNLKQGMTVYYRPVQNKAEFPCIFLDYNEKGYPIIEDMKKNKTIYTLGKHWRDQLRIANEHIIYKKGRTLDEKLINNLKKIYPANNLNQIAKINKHKILIIGNETKVKKEAEAIIEELPLYNWLLLKSHLHPQLFSLCNVYSSKYKEELEGLSKDTLVIYANLEAYLLFNDELKDFSSITLFSPIEEQNFQIDALSKINNQLDYCERSEVILNNFKIPIPKGVDLASWKTD